MSEDDGAACGVPAAAPWPGALLEALATEPRVVGAADLTGAG